MGIAGLKVPDLVAPQMVRNNKHDFSRRMVAYAGENKFYLAQTSSSKSRTE